MSAKLCLEVLVVTIIAWVGVWGIVQELVEIVENRRVRCCLYAALVVVAVVLAALQRSLSVCALL